MCQAAALEIYRMSDSIKRLREMSTQIEDPTLREAVQLFATVFQEFSAQIKSCHSANREDIASNIEATRALTTEIHDLVAEIKALRLQDKQ